MAEQHSADRGETNGKKKAGTFEDTGLLKSV